MKCKPKEFCLACRCSKNFVQLHFADVRFGLVHKFLWDRYRSIRQDLYIQGISDSFAINIFEEIVRFHILCEHELCADDQSGTSFLFEICLSSA